MAKLSDSQKRTKARTILSNMALDEDLSELSVKLDGLLWQQPAEIKRAVTKDELSELIESVKQGTADNEKIARFLELAQKLGLG